MIKKSLRQLDTWVVENLPRRDEQCKRRLPALGVALQYTISFFPAIPVDKGTPTSIPPNPYFKPPINLEDTIFGKMRETCDIAEFTEKCENLLSLRPMSDPELMAICSKVLPEVGGW